MDALGLWKAIHGARAILASEDAWISQDYGADAAGRWTPVGSSRAVRFSVMGAIVRAGAPKDALPAARALFLEVAPDLARKLQAETLRHVEAVALLDAALASLRASLELAHDAPPSRKVSGTRLAEWATERFVDGEQDPASPETPVAANGSRTRP